MTRFIRPLVALVSLVAGSAILVPLASSAGQASATREPITSRTVEIPPVFVTGEIRPRTIDLDPIVIVASPAPRKMTRKPSTSAARRVVALDQGGRPGARSVVAIGL